MKKKLASIILIITTSVGIAWAAGSWSTNQFSYKPQLTTQGTTDYAAFNTSQDRVDARLAATKYVGDPLYPTLSAAISTLNTDGTDVTLIVPFGTHTIATNTTSNSNINLVLQKGAIINRANGVVLTVNGQFEAGTYQVFSGAGTTLFGPGAVEKVYPEWWTDNASPGTTDMTAAVQAAFDAFGTDPDEIAGTIWLSSIYNIDPTGVTLSADLKTITGGGTLYGGPLIIGTIAHTSLDFHFKVDNITIEYDSITSGQHGIELAYAWNSSIQNCRFINCDKGIYVRPIDSSQHVSRTTIDNNRFLGANYAIYFDHPVGAAATYGTADMHITNNQASGGINYGHIYALGLDGAIITGNTFFFPSYTGASSTKANNIYVSAGTWVAIANNNLFEAGTDSILINKSQNVSITGNNIAWPGQRVASSGIKFTGGNVTGGVYCISSVTGNTITHPTYHGIEIADNCGYITLAGNTCYNAGDLTYYYGPATGTIYQYGIYAAATTSYISWGASPNMFGADGKYSILGTNSFTVPESAIAATVLTLSATETTASALGNQTLSFVQTGPTNFSEITDAYGGQILYLQFFNSNTTLKNATGTAANQILLKGGIDVTPASGNRIILRYDNSRWREHARNF